MDENKNSLDTELDLEETIAVTKKGLSKKTIIIIVCVGLLVFFSYMGYSIYDMKQPPTVQEQIVTDFFEAVNIGDFEKIATLVYGNDFARELEESYQDFAESLPYYMEDKQIGDFLTMRASNTKSGDIIVMDIEGIGEVETCTVKFDITLTISVHYTNSATEKTETLLVNIDDQWLIYDNELLMP